MKYIELTLDRELDILIKYQLSPEELLIIKLIFLAQEGHFEYLAKYFSQSHLQGAAREKLLGLQQKGVINKAYKIPIIGEIFNPETVDFNKTFIKSFLQHSNDMGMELFMLYPSFVNIKGRNCSLKNISKNYKSHDDFCFAYGKSIKFDPVMHKKILELLEFAKENNLIHYGLVEFIISMKWLEIEELRSGGLDLGLMNTLESL